MRGKDTVFWLIMVVYPENNFIVIKGAFGLIFRQVGGLSGSLI